MRRVIARWIDWWLRLFVASVVALRFVAWPLWVELGIMGGLFGLSLIRPRWERDRRPVAVDPPVRGRWAALNSPASKVPSHGIRQYGQTYALDVVHPNPRNTPAKVGWGIGMRRPQSFSSFGAPVHSVADGVVVATSRRQRDHRSRETWPSLLYLFVLEAFIRQVGGARFVLGNHVIVEHGDGVFSVLAHLRRGSVTVAVGDRVRAGQPLGEVGNSGNSSEPHLHVQLMDRAALGAAAGVPQEWPGIHVVPGDIDRSRSLKPVSTEIVPGLPANGQVFSA